MSYWYFDGAEGRRYAFAKDPSYRCPVGALTVPDDDQEIPERFASAAATLGMDARLFLAMIQRAHRGNNMRLRVDKRLTDRCAHCGHKMERLGFRCWIDRPRKDAAGERVAGLIGFGPPTETVKTLYLPTKREARDWAREEAKIDKEATNAHPPLSP